jgi:hypothetical protein
MSNLTEQKTEKSLAAAADLSSWGTGHILTSNDIILPKIWPLQFMSEKVKAGLGKYGEFRDSVNNELFGTLDKPFEVIPFHLEGKWMEFDIVTNKAGARKREFKQIVPIQNNPGLPGYNDNLPFADDSVERDRIMDFYVLIPSEIEKGTALPYVISFKRSSIKAGKKLAMQMYIRNRDAKLPPAAVVCNISGKSVQNDDGEFVVMDVNTSRRATNEELECSLKWWQQVERGLTKVDESEYKDEGVQVKEVNKKETKF